MDSHFIVVEQYEAFRNRISSEDEVSLLTRGEIDWADLRGTDFLESHSTSLL
jgi:hypothetical protein